MPDLHGFDEKSARRIVKATKWVERNARRGNQHRRQAPATEYIRVVAKITSGSNPYSAVEVVPGVSGTWTTRTGGITFAAAGPNKLYERNDVTDVAADTIVEVYPAYFNGTSTWEWTFDYQTADTFVSEAGIVANILTDNARMCIQTRTSAVSVAATGFTADRWLVETQNNGVDYADQSNPFTGSCCAARFTKTTSTGKFLVVQWLKSCPYKFYNGRAVHIQMAVKASKALTLRSGFLLWGSTADAPTSPHVSAWNGNGTDPTFAANFSYSVFSATITTSYANWSISDAAIASFTNLAFIVWTNDQLAAGDWIEFTDAFAAAGTAYLTPYPVAPKIDIDACAYHGTLGGVFN